MSTKTVTSCDVCEKELPDWNEDAGDTGVWLSSGRTGIPHICRECREWVTIGDVLRWLRLSDEVRRGPVARARFWRLRRESRAIKRDPPRRRAKPAK